MVNGRLMLTFGKTNFSPFGVKPWRVCLLYHPMPPDVNLFLELFCNVMLMCVCFLLSAYNSPKPNLQSRHE